MDTKVSRNVRTFMDAHERASAHDLDGVAAYLAPGCVWHDHARDVTMHGTDEIRGWLGEWFTAMSDARVTDAHYTDAGKTVIAQFVGRGTHDGPMGPFAATGKEMRVEFCEISRFNDDGRIVSEEIYYDQMTIMRQLGLAPEPE